MIDPGFRGKVALVTGGNHGIGASTALALAAHGASVFITYLRLTQDTADSVPEQPGRDLYHARQALSADHVVEVISDRGGEAAAWEADLADSTVIPELFDRAEEALGPVSILVNNAAHCEHDTFVPQPSDHQRVSPGGYSIGTLTAQTHDQHFAINSRASSLLMVEFSRRHTARSATWGRIINVSTDAAAGAPDTVSYWASKYALESYSRCAALELGQYGITVNVVAPGPIQTGWMSQELMDREAQRTPLGRVGEPEDVADVIVFLASEQSRWLTGQLVYVGGGHRMPG